VGLNGLDAQVKFFRNITRAFALADELKNLKFAVGQFFNRRTLRPGASAGKNFQDVRRHFFADVNFTGEHLPDGQHQFFATLLFHDVAAPARAQHALGVKRFVVHGNDQHRQAGLDRLKILDEFEAVFSRQ